jgi:hypothetical protein
MAPRGVLNGNKIADMNIVKSGDVPPNEFVSVVNHEVFRGAVVSFASLFCLGVQAETVGAMIRRKKTIHKTLVIFLIIDPLSSVL